MLCKMEQAIGSGLMGSSIISALCEFLILWGFEYV